MANMLGYKSSHLALASNSDEIIAKRAYRDAEIRFEKLKVSIVKVLESLDAVSIESLTGKAGQRKLEWAVTSATGTRHLLKILTSPTARSRYKNVVRTTIDVKELS